ncbi:diguanylate cyclase domain-containing protein [Kurthia sibirica]|uniref:GGDEF domain-containing protein n=1 Tax=Kurthia sibirica TaxID=202750 RepID=A0A2U3AP03_9BACL|nr:diguanylate cyclase [Kurthia sibirica]PWI26264.1 hypothetical protein DEX24_04885 [Kurthia sibirica]GEK33879.1 hypothetical protein KSI01_14120 [Kurthia sibirica]
MHHQSEDPELPRTTTYDIKGAILQLNLNRLRFVSTMSLLIFSTMFAVNFYNHFISQSDTTNFILYAIPYSLAILINMLAFAYTTKRFNKKYPFKKNVETRTFFQYSYLIFMLLLSSIISFLDQIYFNHITIFILYLVLCCCAIIMPIKRFIVPVTLSSLITISSLMIDMSRFSSTKMMIIFIIFLVIILLVLNHLNYKIIHKTLLQQQLLMEERLHSQQLTKELQTAANTDELTNLANRRGYLHHIATFEMKLPMRITVLIIDIDFFKNYNDYYGHAYGDIVLAKVASTLHEISKDDQRFAVRWGGEEFLILLEDHSNEEIKQFYTDFITQIAHFNIEHMASDISKKLTFSVGGNSIYLENLDEINDCILQADDAQYVVKRSKKDDFLLLDDGLTIYISDDILNHC